MDFIMKYINLSSMTFWSGVGMIVAGLWKSMGLDIPVIPDVEFINTYAPEDAATLFKAGFALIFMRGALPGK